MSAYFLFTHEQLETALDAHVAQLQQFGMALEEATNAGTQIRAFLVRSEAALKHGLRIEQQPTESTTRGPGVTG